MKAISSTEVRDSFLDFFRSKEHEIVPSSPVYLPADKTLKFVNAGMVPFKEIFLGARESTYRRVANSQKCIRVSGKHNDLEDVGRDTYHHTFFEMLGNWSFGDYYKQEAISWAWELLTGVWGLPKERLYATVYQEDDEAVALWKNETDIDPDHIQRHDEKDNFWEMGETGPCGPCSEIHIDLTDDLSGAALVNADSPEVIEIWNLVFIQYNRRADKSLEELPARHVDTGMGFERLVAVLQGKKSNYDTDIFKPIIDRICERSGRSYAGEDAVAMRVIADHLRMVSFAIGDGVIPSNEDRNYIVRMLIRRAVRFGRKLGFDRPFMSDIFPVLEAGMGRMYPELTDQRETILLHLHSEEEKFARNIDRGTVHFNEVVERVKAEGDKVIGGRDAFKLYDTYGFPFDLTRLMAEEQGLQADADAFEQVAKEEADHTRERSMKGGSTDADLVADLIAQGVKSEFTGYDHTRGHTRVLKLVREGAEVQRLETGEQGAVMLEQTPFYAESGGQIGDTGTLRGKDSEITVTDTNKPAEGLILHAVIVEQGSLSVGDEVGAEIDEHRRIELERNHSGTHLLNGALREHINDSIRQAGSYVGPDRLRFDFTYPEALKPEQLDALERQVNDWIMGAAEVRTYEMPLKDVAASDIIAVFDEKYGDTVRVVDIGGYSKELCGGTHVDHVGRLGGFRIVGESSVQAGVRRIEAVTGAGATERNLHEHGLVRELSRTLSAGPDELVDRVRTLLRNNKAMEKELKQKASASALANVGDLLDAKREVRGVSLIAAEVDNQPVDALRNIMDELRRKMKSGVIVIGSNASGKAGIVASVSDDLVRRGVHAGNLVKALAGICGGGGGGAPNKAQAGGKDGSKIGEAVGAAAAELAGMLD